MVHLKHPLQILKKEDVDFPWRLKALADCPDVLYVMGDATILNDFAIAIVGSRVCDEYGRKITRRFTEELSARGVCIVSGLAEGIDTEAHEATLEQSGKTVAVLGGGFAHVFPKCNQKLLDKIVENGGAIVSEYDPEELPKRFYFPKRNRIVAGMVEGVLITQARERSGALITAHLAKEYQKKIFAVPSNLDNVKSMGGNRLLKQGAQLVLTPEEILAEFPTQLFQEIERKEKIIPKKFQMIYQVLQEGSLSLNEMSRKLQRNVQQLMVDLMMMEMEGYVKELPGKIYEVKF